MIGERFIHQLKDRFQLNDYQILELQQKLAEGIDLSTILLDFGFKSDEIQSFGNLRPSTKQGDHIQNPIHEDTHPQSPIVVHSSSHFYHQKPINQNQSPETINPIFQSTSVIFSSPSPVHQNTDAHSQPPNHLKPNFSPTNDIGNLSTFAPVQSSNSQIGALQHDEVAVDHLISLLLDVSDRFDIFEEIAHGAMGKIEAGWDRHLGRPVAIKTLKNDQAKDVVRMRFLEEAQVTGQLQHPNIVTVYELARIKDNVAFIMRKVEGESLKQLIQKLKRAYDHQNIPSTDPQFNPQEVIQKYSISRRLRIFQQLCQAVAFAHSRGVIHRDIKPSNVMVGDFGDVVLLDWGLCKIIGKEIRSSRSSEERWHTMHGQIIGTPAYMSPEQAMGMVDMIGFPTDVYGLGALLYHLLTLSPAFVGKSNREVVKKVLQNEPVPPCQRAPEQHIPKEIELICMKCLEKKQEDRYADATELSQVLQAYLDEGVKNQPTSNQYPSSSVIKSKINPQEIEDILFQYQSILEDLASLYDVLNHTQKQSWLYGDSQFIQEHWEAQQQIIKSKQQSELLFHQLSQQLSYAIFESNDFKTKQELKEMYCALLSSRYEQAMIEGDFKTQIQCTQKLKEYDSPLGEQIQQSVGALYIHIKANHAKIQLWHLVTDQGKLKAVRPKLLRNTPLLLERVPAGQYVLTAEAANAVPIECSMQVNAGLTTRFSATLYKRDAIPLHFIHIPSGSFKYGSPHDTIYSPSEQALPDFFLAEYPVLSGDYLLFLQDLCTTSPQEAVLRQPRLSNGSPLWVWNDYGMIFLDDRWTYHTPVVGISYEDAERYCQWYSMVNQINVRLASDLEWEKAARGSDGRAFSWGDMWDPRFCAGPELWENQLQPPEVGFVASDRSVYGVRDLVGGVREWTTSTDPDFPFALIKGGSFLSDDASGRFLWRKGYLPKYRVSLDIGFRLVFIPDAKAKIQDE